MITLSDSQSQSFNSLFAGGDQPTTFYALLHLHHTTFLLCLLPPHRPHLPSFTLLRYFYTANLLPLRNSATTTSVLVCGSWIMYGMGSYDTVCREDPLPMLKSLCYDVYYYCQSRKRPCNQDAKTEPNRTPPKPRCHKPART